MLALYKENGNVSRHHNKPKNKFKPNQCGLHKYGSSAKNHKVKEKKMNITRGLKNRPNANKTLENNEP